MKNLQAKALSLPKGYTLVELIITVAIIAILVVMGVSAYTQAQGRQIGKSAGELVVSLLQENLKQAKIGDSDCFGSYLGQVVTFQLPGTVTSVSSCTGGSGTPKSTTISGITFLSTPTLTFKPLASGIDLGGTDSLLLRFTSNALTYQIQITKPGTIEYQGIQ